MKKNIITNKGIINISHPSINIKITILIINQTTIVFENPKITITIIRKIEDMIIRYSNSKNPAIIILNIIKMNLYLKKMG